MSPTPTAKPLTKSRDFIGKETNFRNLINSTKKMTMLISLASEINSLSHQLDRISERNRHYRDFTLNSLTFAIREVIACLSVYRTYNDASTGTVAEGSKYIKAAVEEAKRRNPRTARASSTSSRKRSCSATCNISTSRTGDK